jgi:hypothetical protein
VVPTNEDGCPANPDESSAEPCLTFELTCPKFGLGVRMVNADPAALDAHFVITVDGTTDHEGGGEVTVAPGVTVFRNVHIGENSTVTINIEETVTGLTFVDGTFTRDCTDPSASVEPACADGALVTLNNPSELQTVDFVIDVYDGGAASPTRTFTVDDVGPTSATQVVPNAGDGPQRIVVTALTQEGPNGTPPTAEVVADESVVVDCEQPAPTAQVSFVCGDDPTITVTLAATDEQAGPTTFHVEITDDDGTVVLARDVTITGTGTETVTDSDLAEDQTHTVTVTVGETTLTETSVLVDCEEVEQSSTTQTTAGPTTTTTLGTEVRGTQVRSQLPRTGSGAGPQLLVAVGLVLAGAGLVGFGAVPFMATKRR